MLNPTIQSELELFKKTGNSTHARWIANELIKVIGDSKLNTIDQLHDVTVGHGSGGEVKSGLLWAVVALNESKCRVMVKELEKEKAQNRQLNIRLKGVNAV
jgi:hypothetical protein